MKKISVFLLKRILFKNVRKYGKCKILEDKVICFVDEKKLKKHSNDIFWYKLNLYGIPLGYKEIASKYGFDKPVEYVIEGIKFDKRILVNSYNADIIFRKCIFSRIVAIDHAANITFENNKYTLKYANYVYGLMNNPNDYFWLENRDIGEIECIRFINDDLNTVLDNKESKDNGKNLLMKVYLRAKRVEVINSEIKNNTVFLIDTEKLIMENSSINSDEVYITADNIESDNSNVIAKDGVIIESDGQVDSFLSDIESSNIFYNGKEFGREEILEEDKCLHEQRILLLNTLKNIKNNCDEYILKKINEVSNNINNKTVRKILKK